MWDNDLQRAKQAIERKDYEAARVILEMMPENHIARKWLGQLNRKNLKFRHDKDLSPTSRPLGSPERPQVPMPALVIIGLSMLFWALLLLITSAMNPYNSQIQSKIVLFVLSLGFGLPIVYYVFWRWFWWALAGVWILLTLASIVALAMGYQITIPYSWLL